MRNRIIALAGAASVFLAACGTSSSPPGSSPSTDDRPLRGAAVQCSLDPTYGTLGDDNQTLKLDGKGEGDDDGLTLEQIMCVLHALSASDAVIDHISTTRALDGTQTDTWPGYKARWTFHPDAGLSLIIQEQ